MLSLPTATLTKYRTDEQTTNSQWYQVALGTCGEPESHVYFARVQKKKRQDKKKKTLTSRVRKQILKYPTRSGKVVISTIQRKTCRRVRGYMITPALLSVFPETCLRRNQTL